MNVLATENSPKIRKHGDEESFADFMARALYGVHGYYMESVRIGRDGADFYTAALSPLFSMTLAKFIVDSWSSQNNPEFFQIVELGAGQGELAEHILSFLVAALPPHIRIQYVIVEVSPRLQEQQMQRLARWGEETKGRIVVQWTDPLDSLPTILIANEVLDALPVERVRKTKDGWEQAFVQHSEAGVSLNWRPASPQLVALAQQYIACPNGTEAEICLDYSEFFRRLATYGKPISALFFDYGITRLEWQSGVRPQGTVRGFRNHEVVNIFEKIGETDLTADVNWDYARATAQAAGFQVDPLVTQARFLMNFGILDALQSLHNDCFGPEMIQQQAALTRQFKQLVFPGGMGERFSVMTCKLHKAEA